MSYEELLKQRIIESVATSPEEIVDLLKMARRDIETANKMINVDLDWAFAIAYNSILQRRKRNATIYKQKGIISEKEALDAINFAKQYFEEIKAVLPPEIASLLNQG